jgi:transposase-like protein
VSGTNILQIAERIPDEAAAYEYLEGLRWDGKPECPHCGIEDRCYFLTPANGKTRKTRTGAVSQRRVWKCGACRKQFSVLTNTIMHGTKIPVRTWVFVIFEMCASKNGVAAREIERKYGIAPRSAWFMTQRIREAMKGDSLDLLGGDGNVIVADETFIGGKPKNRHRQGQARRRPEGGKGISGSAGLSEGRKVAVLTLIDKAAGEARSRVIPNVQGNTLAKAIAEQVNIAGSVLHTDAGMGYRDLGRQFIAHHTVDHSSHEYVRGDVTSNQAENFFSQLKRSLDGTHHHVSKVHLHRYLAEFDFRYSTREIDDTERMARLAGRVGGRRLAYRPLTSSRMASV